MPLPASEILALSERCAPLVSPATMLAIVQTESGGDQYAIGVNGPQPTRLRPRDETEAVRISQALVRRRVNFDVGLGQINSRNLEGLGLSISAAFDPCRNLAASARILAAGFLRAASMKGQEQAALQTSLSFYNTGDAERGFRNGYVARVMATAQHLIPALQVVGDNNASLSEAARLEPPPWDVFADAPALTITFVFQPQTSGDGQ